MGELRRLRSRFRQLSVPPISFTGISESSGFLLTGWADRVELLLIARLFVERLVSFNKERLDTAAERLLHVSGVVAVLASALTVSALGRSRIAPYNWSFVTDLWDQIAFWARSLIFILALILVPRLLGAIDSHDLLLLAALIAAAFASGNVTFTRPLCPYPEEAVYGGHGDTTDAANFACRMQHDREDHELPDARK